MPLLPAVPPKPHRRPVALFPPDSEEDEYDLPGLITKRSVEKAPAAPSKGNDDEEDTVQTDNEDDDDEEVTKKASSSKGRAGATNLTPTQWAVIVSMD
jgi:hypothetical protein